MPYQQPQNVGLSIAFDYGTTYTSVAYLLTSDADRNDPAGLKQTLDRVQVINAYPGKRNGPEVPSVLLYEPAKQAQPTKWGYEVENAINDGMVPEEGIVVRLAKLALHNSDETQAVRQNLQAQAKTIQRLSGHKPNFIVDFLRKLREHVLAELEKSILSVPEADKWDWVFCVPAAWSEEEHRKLREAAELAGIPSPSLVSEPEAAALVVLLEKERELPLKAGDTFIVNDGGGGTVDIVTYEVIRKQPLRLRETAVGEGILCGSTYLDKNFDTLLKEKLELEKDLATGRIADVIHVANNRFKEYKLSFTGPGSVSLITRLEVGDAEKGFWRSTMAITSEEITERVFQPIVDQIQQMLKKQIQESGQGVHGDINPMSANRGGSPANVQSIVLTGGLGDNPHLFNELTQTWWTEAPPRDKIKVVKPEIARTAVARGGVILGLNGAGVVSERRSRFSYGFDIAVLYDTKAFPRHKGAKRRKDLNENKWFVDEVWWILWKNQPVREGQVFKSPVRYRNIRSDLIHEPVSDVLLVSKTVRDCPTWKGARSRAEDEYKIFTDLSSLDWEAVDYRVSEKTGQKVYKLFYHIEMRISTVNSATFEIVTHLPNGRGIHRQSSDRPFKCDTNIASLDMRKEVGPPRRISAGLSERRTSTHTNAESIPRQSARAKRAKRRYGDTMWDVEDSERDSGGVV